VTLPVVVIVALLLGHAADHTRKLSAHPGTGQPTALAAITVAAPPLNAAADAPCTKLLGALPITLADLAGRPARSTWTYVAAWGDPAVVLRCGVPRPSGLTAASSDFVLAANGDHAAATTKRGVRYAYQSVGMTRAALKPRAIVRRSSR